MRKQGPAAGPAVLRGLFCRHDGAKAARRLGPGGNLGGVGDSAVPGAGSYALSGIGGCGCTGDVVGRSSGNKAYRVRFSSESSTWLFPFDACILVQERRDDVPRAPEHAELVLCSRSLTTKSPGGSSTG